MKYLFIIFSLIGPCAIGQLKFYYPDGTLYPKSRKTINEINNDFDPHGRIYVKTLHSKKSFDIGYRLFTDEPLWVLSEDTIKIKQAVKVFNLEEFLKGYQVEIELEKHIKSKSLTDIFIAETLGGPTWRDKEVNANGSKEIWGYDNLKLNLLFTNGIVTSFRRYH